MQFNYTFDIEFVLIYTKTNQNHYSIGGVNLMRIIIDTVAKKIICPKTFWDTIDKQNEALRSAGVAEISHKEKVKEYFAEAIVSDLARSGDIKRR